MPIINYRRPMVIFAWYFVGFGVYRIGQEFIQDGFLSIAGSISLLCSLWSFFLISKMEVRTNPETESADSIQQ